MTLIRPMQCFAQVDGSMLDICAISEVEPAPYSHNLINLAQSCGLGLLLTDEQRVFVGELMHKTKELQQWVKTML